MLRGILSPKDRGGGDVAEILLRLHIERLPEGVFLATCDGVPGLVAEGRTVSETVEIARDVARKIAESCLEHDEPLPPAFRDEFPGAGEVITAVAL